MTSNTFITFNVYSCCNWCLSQLNAERMILINGDLKKIFADSASGSGTRASSYHTAGGYSTNISY